MQSILLFISLFVSAFCQAQKPRGAVVENSSNNQPNTYAIIVGISNYSQVQDLEFADRDATFFADYLRNDCEIASDNIKLFTNEAATRFNIVDELYSLNERVKPGDFIFLYFAGHGDLESKITREDALLLLYNSLKNNYLKGTDYIFVYELKKWLENLAEKEARIIFISDACHSGSLVGGKEGQDKTLMLLANEWKNHTKLLSCQINESSLESREWGGGRGLFSYHLIEGLQGLGDENQDGFVTLFELQNYLQKNVRVQALPHHQTPVIRGDLDLVVGKVNPSGLKALVESKKNTRPVLAQVKIKSAHESIAFVQDSSDAVNYRLFNRALNEKRLLKPDSNSAKFYLAQMSGEATRLMRRNLAAALQAKAMNIIDPLLKGEKISADARRSSEAAYELRQAMELLGENHYLSNNLEARALFLESYAEASQNKGKNALTLLKKSIDLEPNASYSFLLSGVLYQRLANYDAAISHYKRYLEQLPKDSYVYYNLGAMYIEKRNYEEATKYLQNAVDISPENALFLGALSNAQVNIRQYKKAGANRQKAISIEDRNTEH